MDGWIYLCCVILYSIPILFSDPSQVLMNVLSSRKNMSDSLAYGRLHPQLKPNTLLVDCEFFQLQAASTSIVIKKQKWHTV